MRDFIAHVRRNLPRDAPAERYDEIVEELAAELETRYMALVRNGTSDEEAWNIIVAQVPSWPALARDLSAAGQPLTAATPLSRVGQYFVSEHWRREFRVGLRALRKDRGFTATAILTLAVCLGGHAAIATAVNELLLQPLRVPEPHRVLLMANQYPRVEGRRGWLSSTPDYDDRRRHVTAFEEQAFYNYTAATMEIDNVPTRMRGVIATPSLFRVLRVTPALGRIFTDAEGTTGNDARIILSDGLWREVFGADPAAVGRTLRLNGTPYTIVGILPRDFSFADPIARFWIPLALTDRQRSDDARHRNGWYSIGRLKPGATIEQARDQLEAMDALNFERSTPRLQSLLTKTGFYTGVEPLEDMLVRNVRGPLSLLWLAAVAVLLIGVGNLATIALARSRARLGDLGTRLALGASRFDIARQLFVESALVAAGGAAGGLAVAAWMLGALRATQPGSFPLHVDEAAGWVTVGLALSIAVVMGLVSASPLFTARLGTMMHEGHRSGTQSKAVRRLWRALIAVQMTCSFTLLLGSALLYVSLRNVLAVDPGFRTDVVTGFMSLSGSRYASDDSARAFLRRALESIRALPGVAAAGVTTIVPMSGSVQTGVVIADGYVAAPGESPVAAVRSVVSPGYFEAVATPLLRGRYFDNRDEDPASRAVVIDERLAHRFWPDGTAIGRRLFCPMTSTELASRPGPNTPWLTVIGVVRTARLTGPTADEDPSGTTGTYYVTYGSTAPRDVGLVIRTDGEPGSMVREVRSAVAQLDRELPLFDVRTLRERTELALGTRTSALRLAVLFAGVGVFLSALGLYGMLAYLVTQRTREIGIRLAVGSTPRAVVGLLLREGLSLAVVGVGIGAAASLASGRVLASYLYGVAPSNPVVMLLTATALAGVAVLACILPARRAAHVDVMRILTAS